MEKDFLFPEESEFFVNAQITAMPVNNKFYYNLSISEYSAIEKYIKKPKIILDLGCGLGRMSIFLNWKLQDPDIHYILADGTCNEKPTKIKYGWNPNIKDGFCKVLVFPPPKSHK